VEDALVDCFEKWRPLHFIHAIHAAMNKLRAMQVFARVVEAGSLTAAASTLQVSGPSVVRSLAALERSLGVRLLQRTTRRSSLTDEGREYYERCKRILAEMDEAEALMSARRSTPKGKLRLTAPVTYGKLRVAPRVAEFIGRYPEVEVELLLLDRIVDLVEEGMDAAVRIGSLPDSTLVARPIDETHRVVCAAPAYLRRAGTPKSPADLAAHRCIVFSGLSPTNEWTFGGKPRLRAAVHPVLRTNQVDAALDACLRGVGCGQFLRYQVEGALREGKLRRVLAEFEPPALPIWIVYPHARPSSNVRAFIDLMTGKASAK
jgi:DNA-binding transcriptional LysR family regulator